MNKKNRNMSLDNTDSTASN